MATASSLSSEINEPKNVIRAKGKTKDEKESLLYVEKGGMYGGYRIHLLKEELPPYLKSFVICSNCEGILRDACAVGDTHSFMCLTCTQGRDSIVLKPNREAVASLIISCPLKYRGCGWEGKISESEPHLDVCGLFRLECQLSCGDVINRSGMSTHLDKNCPLREIQCEYCAVFHKEKETNIHQENCLEFPLKCPNKCGDVLQRKNLRQHTEEVCENTVIECPYKEYGCEVKVARKEMEQHKSENRLIHLELKTDSVCGKLQVLQEENVLMKKEINLNRSLLLFEGKTTFRINNVTELDEKAQHVADLMIPDMRDDQIQISCLAVPSVVPTSSGIVISIRRQKTTKLLLKGCIVIINQSDYSINSKHEYSFEWSGWFSRFQGPFYHLRTKNQVEIPYEEILQPGVCVDDSILVQLYYNRVPQ